jgi:hypothetical protein
MIKYYSAFASILLVLLAYQTPFAQGIFESETKSTLTQEESKPSIEFNGFARGLAYGGSENFDFNNVFAEFALKGRLAKNKAFLFADVRIREGLFFDNRDLQLQLKEVYAGYRGDKIDVLLGNQIVVWGRTDGFNPTNNITPNDYFFLTNDPDDQKLSNFMLRSKVKVTNAFEIDLIAIPFFKPSVYRYNLFQTNQPISYLDLENPEVNFENSTLAARLNFELPRIGFSFSYFNGYDPFYGFTIDSYTLDPMWINYKPKVYHKQTVGFDFALPINSTIIRGEMALNLTNDYATQMHIPNPDFYYVLGIERNIIKTTAILQYIGKYTLDFSELTKPILTDFTPEAIQLFAGEMMLYESVQYNRRIFNQQEETNHAIMLSLARSFLYEELNVELAGLYNFTSDDYLIRGNVRWSVTDALSANLGASYMLGPDKSIYNMAGKAMNGVYVGLTVKF